MRSKMKMFIAKYIGGYYSSVGLKFGNSDCDKLYDVQSGTLFIISVSKVAVPQFGMNYTVGIHYQIGITSFKRIGVMYPKSQFTDDWEILAEFDELNVHSFIDALNKIAKGD